MKQLGQQLTVSALGIEMGAAVGVGYFLGHWVDGELGTRPWGMLFLLLCGIGAAFKGLMREVRKAQRRERERDLDT